MNARKRMAAVSVAVLAVAYCLPTLADEEVPGPVILGTSTPVAELFREMAWDFDMENVENSERRTLDWDGEGPAATRVVGLRMKSTKPLRRTSEGAEYLRFGLTVYEFESEVIALRALDAFKVWYRRIAPSDRMMCKGAVYRAQKGPLVYVFNVGCQFSRQNYDLLVTRLEVALQDVDAGDGSAIQCYCGGGWVERTLSAS